MDYGSIKDPSNRKFPLVHSVNSHSVLKVPCLIPGGVQNSGDQSTNPIQILMNLFSNTMREICLISLFKMWELRVRCHVPCLRSHRVFSRNFGEIFSPTFGIR